MADADALRDAGVPAIPVTPGSTPPPDAAPPSSPDSSVMTLIDHLGELRTRLFRSILAVAIASTIGFLFAATPIRNFLIELLPVDPATGKHATVQTLGLGDAFIIQLKISIVFGVIVAMPVLLYQLWAFVSPGLTPSEKKTVRPWIPLALLFFALGVLIALLVLPYAIAFLLAFNDQYLVSGIAAGPFFEFVTTMFLAFGLIMEFPIVMVGLSRVGILTSERLKASRRMVILGIAIFAAVATPGGDLVSPFVLGGTMYILFELTTFFIKRSGR
jgi:sec-independent protein translocase protein TatC